MVATVSLVALGGALGAALRYLTGVGIVRLFGHPDFPLAIITVNVVGSFLMGVFTAVAAHRGLTWLSPFVASGILGGFTTFSAFSLETMVLIERGATAQAAAYVTLSVAVSVGGLALGLVVVRGILT